MPLTFTVTASGGSKLWDFGWFDRTRFAVAGPCEESADAHSVLRAFFADSIAQRSLCTSPDPWGNGNGAHGPFLIERLDAGWFLPVARAGLAHDLQAVFDGVDRPTPEQQDAVETWFGETLARGGEVFVLRAPQSSEIRWDGADAVWSLFEEFACVNAD